MKEIRELEFYTKEDKGAFTFILRSEINGIKESHVMSCNFKLYPLQYFMIPHVNSDAESSGFYYKSEFKYYFAVYKPSLYK